MTKFTNQREWFKTLSTDTLLSLRIQKFCPVPKYEGQNYDFESDGDWGWCVDKDALYAELATRPHRVRAKDRRKGGSHALKK